MSFGRYVSASYHAASYDRDEFRIFCQRQAARADAVARAIHRRYVDRCLKLASEGATSAALRVEQRGYTFGGSTNHRGEHDYSD